ncbi:MAG: putative RDD family membrane protein YckC [Glaciecola sp.]|jgi:uncharacterized RDD family membrane protein YckC
MTSMDKPTQQSFDLGDSDIDQQQESEKGKRNEKLSDEPCTVSKTELQVDKIVDHKAAAESEFDLEPEIKVKPEITTEPKTDVEVSEDPKMNAKPKVGMRADLGLGAEVGLGAEPEVEETAPEIESLSAVEPDAEASTEIEIAEYVDSSEPIDTPQKTESLSSKETREVVTPYAFTVSPDLLGQALATPTRRGFAILIDMLLITVLTGISSLILAGFVALTFFKAGNRLKQQKNFNLIRLSLRGSAAVLIFVIVYAIISDAASIDNTPLSESAQIQENEETMRSLLDLASELIEIQCSGDSECLLEFSEGAAIGAAALEIPVEDINATASDIISQKEWSDENKSLFMNKFVSTFNEERNAYNVDVLEVTQPGKPTQAESPVYSVIEWLKGIMSDLGLGLGWAALYFSVFTAWWRGQTIGKKLLGIEVVKLDGNYPSLWESFGRYGGYGAGFATGLLGFLQIYWDPNRQAIQDKISETLVLRLKVKKMK